MRRSLLVLLTVVTALAAGAPARAEERPAPIDSGPGMRAFFDAYFATGLDLASPLAVRGLVLRRDAMTLTLAEGVLHFSQPVGGRVMGAWFEGSGTLEVTPPNAVDRRLLADRYGRPEFEE